MEGIEPAKKRPGRNVEALKKSCSRPGNRRDDLPGSDENINIIGYYTIEMIIIPATIEGIRTRRDRTWALAIGTQELTPEKVAEISKMNGSMGYVAFKMEKFNNTEEEILESLKADYEDTGKTPGQRLRGVLYRAWEQKDENYSEFYDFYQHHMEKIINHFKGKLE